MAPIEISAANLLVNVFVLPYVVNVPLVLTVTPVLAVVNSNLAVEVEGIGRFQS